MISLPPRITNPFKYALYMLAGFVLFDLFVTGAVALGIGQDTLAGALCIAILIGNMSLASKVCTALFDGPQQARLNLLATGCDLYFAFYLFLHIIKLFNQTKTAYAYQVEKLAGYA
jgi:hypothetical protein